MPDILSYGEQLKILSHSKHEIQKKPTDCNRPTKVESLRDSAVLIRSTGLAAKVGGGGVHGL